MEVAYFQHEGVEGRFFECEKLSLSLSVSACAGRHVEAQAKERFFSCKDCKLGAQHAGRKAPLVSNLGSKRCARCRRLAPRLVGNRLCVSCYNRERETLKGRNAKGGVPKKLSAGLLLPIHVTAVKEDRISTQIFPHSTGFIESIMSAGRRFGADAGFVAARLAPPVIARPTEWRRVPV